MAQTLITKNSLADGEVISSKLASVLSLGTVTATSLSSTSNVSITPSAQTIDYAGISLSGSSTQSLYQSITNTTAGISASTDISLYNNTGTYLDMGIASTTYNGLLDTPVFSVVAAGDSYVYSTANKLVLGTASAADVVIFAGGSLAANEVMRVTSGGRVGIGTSTPSTTSILELSSTTKGFLPPRLTTTQRDAITTPADGLVVYNSTQTNLNSYNTTLTAWENILDSNTITNVVTITQAAYNALGSPSASTLYIITDASTVGGNVGQYVTVSGDYSITITDYTVNSIATIATNITLPTASGSAGYIFNIKNSGTNTVTVSAVGADLIDGSATMTIGTRYNSMTIQSVSTGWIII